MNSELTAWAIRNDVSHEALAELRAIFTVAPVTGPIHYDSEAAVQSQVRLEAARKGLKLWRNNVGVLEDKRGVPVRYGLANDSKQLNASVKSSDLIGWRPVEIGGVLIAQFVARECKRPGWQYTGTDHEIAQLRWLTAIAMDGGDAKFCTGEGSL